VGYRAARPPLTDYSESIGHRVIILGGGFGGLYAARALGRAPVEVTLIDRRNFHLFQPLLYQVATGSLSPGEISAPLRGILSRNKNTRVLLGEAVDIDAAARQVVLADGARFEYDWLIVATGSRTSYYGHDDWSEWAPSLKTIEEATAIRHKILYAFEAAERAGDPAERSAWLTFVVIGAGATGVELSGALGEIARETLRHDFRSIDPRDARILLLDAGPRVLAAYPEPLSRKAEASLVALGVRARTKVNVVEVDEGGVTFRGEDGAQHHLESRTVLWAGGVTATAFAKTIAARTGAPVDKLGRIRVEPDLSVPGHRRIRIVGDLAAVSDEKGKPLPGVAPVAMQQGAYAAKAIRAAVEGSAAPPPFRYFDKGELAVIGRGRAVANIFGMHMSGLTAWLVWLFVHLMYLVQFQSRILVFIQWGFQYITFARGARLITGTAAKTGGTGEGRDVSA
jgi:NADH dehydrogenase